MSGEGTGVCVCDGQGGYRLVAVSWPAGELTAAAVAGLSDRVARFGMPGKCWNTDEDRAWCETQ